MRKVCDKCGKKVPKKYIKAHTRYEIKRLSRIRVLSGEISKKDVKELSESPHYGAINLQI